MSFSDLTVSALICGPGCIVALERRGGREPDGEQRALRADAEDHREEQREQQRGERHRDVDDRGDGLARAAADDQRRRAEHQAGPDADRGGGEGKPDRQPRRDEDPVEDVLAQVVRAEPVPGRRSLQQVDDVDGRCLRRPENGREDRQQQDQREQDP